MLDLYKLTFAKRKFKLSYEEKIITCIIFQRKCIHFFPLKKLLKFYIMYLSKNAVELQLLCRKGHVRFEIPCFKKY